MFFFFSGFISVLLASPALRALRFRKRKIWKSLCADVRKKTVRGSVYSTV